MKLSASLVFFCLLFKSMIASGSLSPGVRDLFHQDFSPVSLESASLLPWEDWVSYLEKKPWLSVYTFHRKVRNLSGQDSLVDKKQKFVLNLQDYCEKRLRQSRSELNINAVLELTQGSKEDFFKKPLFRHKGLNESLPWSRMYSLVKHGEGEAVSHFAGIIAAMIVKNSGGEVSRNPENFAIATPAGHAGEPHEAKKASYVLSAKVVEILGTDLIPMYLSFTQNFYYCTLDDALTRFDMALSQYAPQSTQKKNILIIDDAVVSGATIWGIKAAFREGVKVSTYGVVNVVDEKFSIEEALNDASTTDARTIRLVISDPESSVTNRTLKTFLNYPEQEALSIMDSLNNERLINLQRIVRDSPRIVGTSPHRQKIITLLDETVSKRGTL